MDSKSDGSNNSRLGYMDTAKGIAIAAVVVGHVYTSHSMPGLVIFSFHMPLFFMLRISIFKEQYANLPRVCLYHMLPVQ